MIQAKLIVVGGDAKVTEINLKLPCIIGRGKGATLTLPHPLVSRQHCEVFESDGKLMVRDLGSLNGTFVGSQRVTEAELPSGKLLTIGTVTFRALYDSEGQPKTPVSPAAETEMEPGMETVREAPSPVDFVEADKIDEMEGLEDILADPEEDQEPPSTQTKKSKSSSPGSANPGTSKPAPSPAQNPGGDEDDLGMDFMDLEDGDDENLGDYLKGLG